MPAGPPIGAAAQMEIERSVESSSSTYSTNPRQRMDSKFAEVSIRFEPVSATGVRIAAARFEQKNLSGCATYKWKLSRPAFLPVVFKLTIQMAAAESQDRVGSSNGPEHS
jgi:hypothetical protein